jgi:hypothetical protein
MTFAIDANSAAKRSGTRIQNIHSRSTVKSGGTSDGPGGLAATVQIP